MAKYDILKCEYVNYVKIEIKYNEKIENKLIWTNSIIRILLVHRESLFVINPNYLKIN